jgi:[CysO sulfur-carrier protein]-S-L-cysteine hydrolase
MRLELPQHELEKLQHALQQAGVREIGGQIFGEQLAPSNFRVAELTIQAQRGSIARFWVDLVQAARDARRFFQRTNRDYQRFNYLGEWHSHPSFAVRPSTKDKESMWSIVDDPDFPAGFAVLLIVKLRDGHIERKAWLFDDRRNEMQIELETPYG